MLLPSVLRRRKRCHTVVEQSEVNDEACIVWDSENEASRIVECDANATPCSEKDQLEEDASIQKKGRYFYYEPPHYEETGPWIPVSVPPMLENDHEEWKKGFGSNGGYFPEGEMGWNQYYGDGKELTMWDVVHEMLLAAKNKVNNIASGELEKFRFSFVSTQFLEQAWNEMEHSLTEANMANVREILECEPPRWLADSASTSCMLCIVRFHPLMCSRHHCRFCGGIFCYDCSKEKSLLPVKFRVIDPQRVCDACYVRLESVQPYLMDQVSRASQPPTHDLTDLSTLRSWLNFPWGQSMEHEIYKATNIIRGYTKVGFLKPEKSIPHAILKNAKGLAILTVLKIGAMVTYNIGTGLVVACRGDGSWSPPSAISSFGAGWGLQGGGELIDFIIVLRNTDAVRTFSSNVHFALVLARLQELLDEQQKLIFELVMVVLQLVTLTAAAKVPSLDALLVGAWLPPDAPKTLHFMVVHPLVHQIYFLDHCPNHLHHPYYTKHCQIYTCNSIVSSYLESP